MEKIFSSEYIGIENAKEASNKIFVNNYVNLNAVKVIGFDLDYTLINYTDELQSLIFDQAKELLIQSYGFPVTLRDCAYDKSFAIRGLSVDTDNGILCKISNIQRVSLHATYRGKQQMSATDIEAIYGESRHISHQRMVTKMKALVDMYSMVEACLIADSIDHFERRQQVENLSYSPATVIEDIETAIREVHVSGTVHDAIVADLPRYIHPTNDLSSVLQKFIQSEKQLFLCTNSNFSYTDHALSFIIGRDWRDIFDVVMCSANKPNFYNTKHPFREWNVSVNRMSSLPVSKLVKGSVYVHGSCHALHRFTGWKGTEVLYIGDNVRADLKEARRTHGWHTACVIHELQKEIDISYSSAFKELHLVRSMTRELVQDLQLALEDERNELLKGSSDLLSLEYRDRVRRDGEVIERLESELHGVNTSLSNLFNDNFGSIFRTDGHPSQFSFAIRRFVDLYMSDVRNLRQYQPSHRFYPSHGLYMVSQLRIMRTLCLRYMVCTIGS